MLPSETGIATEVAKKREKGNTELQTLHIRYLARLFLLEELKEFNSAARNEPDEDTSKNMLHDSLHNALAVAGAMQILRLTDKAESETQASPRDENVTQLAGDPAYLLGMKPTDLSRRLMNIADSITANQELIPDFEAHILQFTQQLCQIFNPQVQPGQSAQEAVLEMIEKKLQGSLEKPSGGDVEDALSRVCEAIVALETTWETTSDLLEHYVLGRHFKADKERLDNQRTLIELHEAHTNRLQHNIMDASYTQNALKALEALNGTLNRMTVSAVEELQMAKDQLEQCERLGPDFHKLAQEFTMTLDNLEHAKQTLKDMEELEDDLDDDAMHFDSHN